MTHDPIIVGLSDGLASVDAVLSGFLLGRTVPDPDTGVWQPVDDLHHGAASVLGLFGVFADDVARVAWRLRVDLAGVHDASGLENLDDYSPSRYGADLRTGAEWAGQVWGLGRSGSALAQVRDALSTLETVARAASGEFGRARELEQGR